MYAQEKEGTGAKAENPKISTPIPYSWRQDRSKRIHHVLIGGYWNGLITQLIEEEWPYMLALRK